LNAFRCSDASVDRDESQIGSASRVRAYFLLECPGRWGQDILRDAQLPRGTRESLAAVARLGVKVLLIRRHGRRSQLSGVNVFAAYADPVEPWLETAVVDSFDEVARMDLSPLATGGSVGLTRTDARLACVCTHGRHDVCCAEQGRPIARTLERSHPDVTWEISHIGGDRFAGNLLLLPHGLYYGRVTADSATTVVSAYTQGRMELAHLRGRSSYPTAVQAAEWYLRNHLDDTALDSVVARSSRRDGDDWTVHLDRGRQGWQVSVRVRRVEAAQLTCRATRLNPAHAHDLVSLSQIA